MATVNSDLMTCKNLGAASINILRAIGIENLAELKLMGSVDAYVRIKQRGIRVSKVMLYAMEGALMNCHWNDLSPAHKQDLVNRAQQQTERASLEPA